MTKHLPSYLNLDEEVDREFRKDMMRIMSEVTKNPANVIPEKQEELAMFMVNELRGIADPNTVSMENWIWEAFPELDNLA